MIDPNEAPEGYVAVAETDACNGCDFRAGTECLRVTLWDGSCITAGRGDGQDVIFIKREKVPAPAAYSAAQVREILFDTFDTLHRLRNYFAGKALEGMLAASENHTTDELAHYAYGCADAMLAAKFATMTWGQK